MDYLVSTIKEDVRIALDEDRDASALLEDADTDALTLDDIIESKIEDGVALVIDAAPLQKLSGWTTASPTPTFNNDLSGEVIIPDYCQRILEVKASDWERPVRQFITPDDPLYMMQFGRWGGLKGSTERPVVCILEEDSGQGNILQFWRCRTANATFTIKYMEVATIATNTDGDDYIYIPLLCYRSAIYQIAALVAQVLGGTQAAQSLGVVSADLLGLQPQVNTTDTNKQ